MTMFRKSDETMEGAHEDYMYNRRYTRLDKFIKVLKRVLPHTAIMIAVFVYTIGGGYIFYYIEHPYRTAALEQTTTTAAETAAINPEISDSATTAEKTRRASIRTTIFKSLAPNITLTVPNGTTSWIATTTDNPTVATSTVNGLRSWIATQLTNGTNGTGASPKTRRKRQKNDEDYEEEDETDPEVMRKKKCNRYTLSVVVENARKECVLAHAQKEKDAKGEFRAHYCASLLSQLSACILYPGFKLEEQSTQVHTTRVQTTTVPPTTTYSTPTPIVHKQCESAVKEEDLTPSSYIFMAFTIISTIGYGHVAPVSMWGRVFCIVYGLIGIPLALLAIADQGRFLSAGIMFCYKKVKTLIYMKYYNNKRRNATTTIEEGGEDEEESMPALLLLILFGGYMLIGGAILTPYEKDWSYIDAVYFTFISSSSIGFGDLLPQEGRYLPLTLFYVALGLALSTAAIDVFAGYLRRLHHWGTKIRNCANKLIWFGGQRVTLSQLVRNVGVQLGVSEEKINHLVEHFDEVVVTTIQQVETGLPPTPSAAPLLDEEEKEPPRPKSLITDIDFIDEKNEQAELK